VVMEALAMNSSEQLRQACVPVPEQA
jgi:hypothetical protein